MMIIKKPFIFIAKAITKVDWANVKVDVWVRYLLMLLTIINTILTHYGKNPIPFSEEKVYTFLSDILTMAILVVNTYKDNPTSKESIETNELKKAMKAAQDLEELKDIFQSKVDEINSEMGIEEEVEDLPEDEGVVENIEESE